MVSLGCWDLRLEIAALLGSTPKSARPESVSALGLGSRASMSSTSSRLALVKPSKSQMTVAKSSRRSLWLSSSPEKTGSVSCSGLKS